MSHFDKFIKDLEVRQQAKKQRLDSLQKDEQHHNVRTRVRLYAERWQNGIRFKPGRDEK